MKPEIIGGSSYRVICDLGRGGMADVQLVLQSNRAGVERLVVVKRVRPELARDPEFNAMFIEEARIAASLSHPNVIQTYEVGQDERGCLLVLEFLRGQAYSSILDKGGLDFRVAVEVLIGALQGLEYAHAVQNLSGRQLALVHRDISPANLFVTYDGQVKVLDFGIAKTLDSTVETNTGVIKGKVAYMAPEQMRGEPADLRADLYAVGAMLWEAAAGRPRFENALPDVAIVSLVSAQLASSAPGAAERGLPALVDEICSRALAHDPEHRYESAEQFHDDLLTLVELVGGRTPPRQLGQYVADLFTVERRALQQKIETELAAWEREKLGGAEFDESLAHDRQVTRMIAQSGASVAPPPSSIPREVPTAAGLQADAKQSAVTANYRILSAALGGLTLLVASYFVFTRLLSPTRLEDAKDPGRPATASAGRLTPVGAESATPPRLSDSAAASVSGFPRPLDPPSSGSPPERTTGSLPAHPLAAARIVAGLGSPPAARSASSASPRSNDAGVELDRSNPWTP